MSRNHLVSTPHAQQTAVARAMATAGYQEDHDIKASFVFDFTGFVGSITTKRLKDDVLSRLAFSCDAYINGALSRMLSDFYTHSKGDGTSPTYPTYQGFLAYIEGLSASEQSLYETGCDVIDSIARIRRLAAMRNEVHSLIASQLPSPLTYVMPDLGEYLGSPRMRNLSASAEAGLISIVEDDTDDEALRAELLAQYKLDDQLERSNQLRMDTMKAKSLVVLWSCIKAGDDLHVTDEDDSFFDLDARTQFGLLNTCMRSVVDTRRKAVTDNRLPVMEKATLRVEAKALMTTLTSLLAHERFAEVMG